MQLPDRDTDIDGFRTMLQSFALRCGGTEPPSRIAASRIARVRIVRRCATGGRRRIAILFADRVDHPRRRAMTHRPVAVDRITRRSRSFHPGLTLMLKLRRCMSKENV